MRRTWPRPVQPVLSEEYVHVKKAIKCEEFKDAMKSSPLLFNVCCPGHAAVQEKADDAEVSQ